jgi:hypothetical protein
MMSNPQVTQQIKTTIEIPAKSSTHIIHAQQQQKQQSTLI